MKQLKIQHWLKGKEAAKSGNMSDFKDSLSGTWTSLTSVSVDQLNVLHKQKISDELTGKSKIAVPKGGLLN